MDGLTAEGREVVERAARLARERLAPRAAAYDRDAVNPVDSWRDLHAEHLLVAAVPAVHGGLGLAMPAYVALVRTLAQGCASTAMTLHMHSTVMRFMPPTLDRMLETIGKAALGLQEGMFRLGTGPQGA